MPDLITHALAGHIAGRSLGVRKSLGLLVIGNCLPDLASRLPVRILSEIHYRTGWFGESFWYWMFVPFHLPFGLVVICYGLSQLFVNGRRVAAFAALAAGSAMHLFLDSLQWHASGGEPLLWPVTWQGYEIGEVSPEASLGWIPWLVGASLLVELAHQAVTRLRARALLRKLGHGA